MTFETLFTILCILFIIIVVIPQIYFLMKKVSGVTTYDVMLGELESGRWIVEISNGKETMLFPNDTFASQEEATEFVEKWIHDNHRI